MPVFFSKASRVGCAWVLSSTSMYSGQFDQLTTFSLPDMSCAALAVGLAEPLLPEEALRPLDPQADSTAMVPRPRAPLITLRRESAPRAKAAWVERGSWSFMGGSPAVSFACARGTLAWARGG